MTPDERTALNAEYLLICKGARYGRDIQDMQISNRYADILLVPSICAGWGVWKPAPDYLSDEADAWRRVKALYNIGRITTWDMNKANRTDGCKLVCELYPKEEFGVCGDDGYTSPEAPTLEEATMRACIALKVRVPNA